MKILIIRFNELGDVVLASSLCESIRRSVPGAEIHYLTYAPYDELFSSHGCIDKVIGLTAAERNKPLIFLHKIWRLSRNRYDAIIDAQSTTKSQWLSVFSRSCLYRIGRQRKRRSWAYTHHISEPKLYADGSLIDKLQQRLSLLQPLHDAGFVIKPVADFHLQPAVKRQRALKQQLISKGVNFERPIFVFNISAKKQQKKWCRLKMAELIDHCRANHQAQIVLFAGLPHEQADVERIYHELESQLDVFKGLKLTGLADVPALFSLCNLFIGNEGGPRHLAQAVGTPTVAICSPSTEKQEWLPPKSAQHQAIEWRDISVNDASEMPYEWGCSTYYRLYNSIQAGHVKPIIDAVCAEAGLGGDANAPVKQTNLSGVVSAV